MEWFIAVGVIVLMVVVIVGLFHGPSHDHRPRRAAARAGAGGSGPGPSDPGTAEPTVAASVVAPLVTPEPLLSPAGSALTNPPLDPPAYTLPPPRPRRHRVRRPVGRPGGRRT